MKNILGNAEQSGQKPEVKKMPKVFKKNHKETRMVKAE